jgi:hypothetical protein
MRNRPHVVEELAEQVPAAVALHHGGSDQQIACGFHRILQEKAGTVFEPDVAQTFVGRRTGPVIGVRG